VTCVSILARAVKAPEQVFCLKGEVYGFHLERAVVRPVAGDESMEMLGIRLLQSAPRPACQGTSA
jgi:hypothetical protein